MKSCTHPNFIPGLDANFCPECRVWFQQFWQAQAEVVRARSKGKGQKNHE